LEISATQLAAGSQTYSVTYSVTATGEADVTSVEYTDASGDAISLSDVSLLWKLTFIASGGATVALAAEGTVDGKLLIEHIASDSAGPNRSSNRSCTR